MVDWWAELGMSCNGSLDRGLRIVDAAAEAGFTTVKIPYWHVDELFRPGSISDERREMLRGHHLDFPTITALAKHARGHGMRVAVSVTNRCRVAEAAAVADVLKVGSYEILKLDLIRACAETGLPVVISCGMANEDEVGEACLAALEGGCRGYRILACFSAYPSPPGLRAWWLMSTFPDLDADGYSDHSHDPYTVLAAVDSGAEIIELHLDLEDRQGGETAKGHVWTPSEAAAVIARASIPYDDNATDEAERQWRADPRDGMRPMREE